MSMEGTEILGKIDFHENAITNSVVKMNFPTMIILKQEMWVRINQG